MRTDPITPAIYVEILAQARAGVPLLRIATSLGIGRTIVRKAWSGEYAFRYPWAVSIHDVLTGKVPEPVMPDPPPDPPSLPKVDGVLPPDGVEPPRVVSLLPRLPKGREANLPKPAKPTAPTKAPAPLRPDTAVLEATKGQAAALAELREALSARVRAASDLGPKFDAYHAWLMDALLAYAESMSGPGVVVSLNDLLTAAQIGGIVAQTIDKMSAGLERVVVTEQRFGGGAKDEPKKRRITPEEARERLARATAKYGPLVEPPREAAES